MDKQIKIRPFAESDMELVKSWASRPELAEYFRRHPHTFTWQFGMFASAYLVERAGAVVGLIDLANYDHLCKKVDFGLMMLPECPDKRLTYIEACSEVGDYLFKYLNFNKAVCRVLAHRSDFIANLEEIGWKQEGMLRENCWFQEKFYDEVQLSILKKDWYEYRGTRK